MSFKNKESLIHLTGFVFLVAQCLCMVEGKVHFYEFVVSAYYIIVLTFIF